jgi:nicotinate-nucleotide pyrophosphorylase (carboxylating)
MLSIDQIIKSAVDEDMPNGDITTDSLLLKDRSGRAQLIAKEDLVLSGSLLFEKVFLTVNKNIEFHWLKRDSELVLKNQKIVNIKGPLADILKAERVALNFLGKMAGIATLTRCFVDQLIGLQTQILDTRKTTPLFRQWERMAVQHGGGKNHRLNLSDRVLIKENHIQAAGGITKAIELVRAQAHNWIQVETRSLDDVKTAVAAKVNSILLDNMSNEQLVTALKIIPSLIETEASGNMNLERIRSVAETGVQYISVGMLTHSAPTADVSLLIEETEKHY